MNSRRYKLPIFVFVPVNWKLGLSATILSHDMKEIGRIKHGRRTLKKLFTLPLITIETAILFHTGKDRPIFSITLPGNLSFEIQDHNDDIVGFIQPKTFSTLPEFEFVDVQDNRLGIIRPGLLTQSVKIFEGDKIISGQHSNNHSKELKPRQHVWEYKSDSAIDIDPRLILAHTGMPLVPDLSGG